MHISKYNYYLYLNKFNIVFLEIHQFASEILRRCIYNGQHLYIVFCMHYHIYVAGTLYYFGDNDREGWRELFDKYKFPPYEIPKLKPEISFGMAGSFITC